ncbi:hypothetical protein BGZ76_005375 [Entomortierella beljakovae]|nr:hypothetical protein BGZ76_005375 [Entomortierella beljakovae]
MSTLFGRKTAGTKLGTINYARGLVISLYLVSWAFSFIATMLVQTNNENAISCDFSVFSCIVLYAVSKIIIYLFLMEKVYVVTAVGSTRRDFFLYKVNMVLMLPYLGIFILMIKYRNSFILSPTTLAIHSEKAGDRLHEDDFGHCIIGLKQQASLPLIIYDIILSTWLTALFIRPLMSSTSLLQGPTKGKLRDVARRTLIGCVMALLLSSANVFTLVFFQGIERGLICLASCTLDVTLNAMTIHWVTSRGGGMGRSVAARGNASRDRRTSTFSGIISGGGGHHASHDKQVAPLDSHLSITVESYVEEYHQLHYGNTSNI